jgi:dTDP-4-amino-4,6-dideoxygalactose transaminase
MNPQTAVAGPEVSVQSFDFLDLKAQFASIREEVMAAIVRVMESQHFILGPEVKLFEEEIAAKVGAEHAIGCASGTDALILSLMAAQLGEGDEVITTPFSFIATAGSIAIAGAKPAFVDIDPLTYNIDPQRIEAAITPNTRAIMPVHLFGLSADMTPILEIAHQHNLVVIEDAAQAIGSRYKGQNVGNIGDFGCFSFFPSKNLGGAGDGGLVTTNNDIFAERLRMLRVHGSKKRYYHDILGTNSRLDALQAAVLRVKLRHLDQWASGRQDRAERYRQLFAEKNLTSFITGPAAPGLDSLHVYNQFTVRCNQREDLKNFLRAKGVPTEIYYPLSLHLQAAFARLGYRQGDFPVAERASREVLSLPVYPELSNEQQDQVIDSIAEFSEQRGLVRS